MTRANLPTNGFALLITLIVISVTLAVGLSLLNITIKQISLSATTRDSEVAFHAAQTSLECAQQLLQTLDYITNGDDPITFSCFSAGGGSTLTPVSEDSGNTTRYSFSQTWNNGEQDLCSEADMFILDARTVSGGYTKVFFDAGLGSETCDEGDVCAVIFGQGYNRACDSLDSLRTVQRELTISF